MCSILAALRCLAPVVFLFSPLSTADAGTLVSLGASWKFFKGTADPSPTDATAWRQRGFNDASWERGNAPFAYGEPSFRGTDLTGMQGSYTTLYLRQTVSIPDPTAIATLQLRAVVDDGFIAWINGVRVAATNAPASDSGLTRTSVATVATEPFEAIFDLPDSSKNLVAGENTIAVLVLNVTPASPDLVFDLELTSTENMPAPPFITGVSPAPGFVSELKAISVTFNESVTGVRPGDFLLNGVPAENVVGASASYTFTFPQPPFGPVDVSWGPLHTVVDLGNPPLRFDAGVPGSTWAYQLINLAGPNVTNVLPVPGTTLRRLAEVEVSFSRPVDGVDAADLRLNSVAATQVVGVGAGPYRFAFPSAPSAEVTVSWTPGHGIVTDEAVPVAFAGFPWKYRVDPGQPAPSVVINEILAENQTGITDEERDPEDWIELHNRGSQPVDLGGWSLSVDREEEGQWVFPPASIPAGGYLVIWASGKDRREPAPGQRLHTNFKLNPNGDTLQLFGPELPRVLVDVLAYPEQSPNHSYGRQTGNAPAVWGSFAEATPGAANSVSSITSKVDEVHFSVERGFFNAPFNLSLACRTPGSEIRYTLDGSPPTPTNGVAYVSPIPIATTRIVRAAAFASQKLPSGVRTHSYLMNLANNRRLLPVLSLVTATNNLYGRTGIMEYSPRNTTKHGAAWERPVSVEWIRPEDNGGFQLDAGIRVAGGDYIRGLYTYRGGSPPQNKYSFRLYFRGEYGPGRLNYPIFPESTLDSYNTLHLRAGMNDHTNPFIKDEFVRALSLDVGLAACHGTFVYLFLNGVYKGLYNPTERVDDDFLQAYHGGGKLWDVIGPGNQAIRGDATAWSQLRTAVRKDLTIRTNYLEVAARMDLANFVDYLLPLIWADDDDWPHNNTRAARERKLGAKFRFYPWDAEFAFTAHSVSYDTIATTLSSLSPPWGTTDYQAMFNSLKKSPEFKLLFADRVHRAFFNDGPLTDARIRARYNVMKAQVAPSISGFNDVIGSWITGRRRYVTNAFQKAGFLASSNAPVASQFGGHVPAGYQLSLQNLTGEILHTTNGTDPRVAFTWARSTAALAYRAPLTVSGPLHLTARSLAGTNWSAVIDLDFETTQPGNPVRITEIMYHPPGGEAYEYVELENTGGLPVDLSGCSFAGIAFRFPAPFPELAPGAKIVVANDARPADFQRRYPNVSAAGWFSGSLDNNGERIELLDSSGRVITSADYRASGFWPTAADGTGASLEVVDAQREPDDPSNWKASLPGGSPSAPNSSPAPPLIRINELQPGTDRDWLELYNAGASAVQLSGWSLSDNSDPRQFVVPSGTWIPAEGFLRIDCGGGSESGRLKASFNLNRDGETIALFDPLTNRADVAWYGPVADGYTAGRVEGRWALCDPTPEGPNEAATLGPLTGVKINEFLANPDGGDDWIELHNSGSLAVALQGCAVATSNALARIASPAFIGAGGFIVLRADENPGPDHVDLKLPASSGMIALLAPNGEELDRVTYGPQATDITFGRIPDGSGAFQPLLFSATRGASNYLAELGTRLRISEFLARSAPGPDWVEIENVSGAAISLAGYSVGVDAPGAPLLRWPFRLDAQLGASERTLVYFGSMPMDFAPQPYSHAFPTSLHDDASVLTLRDSRDRIIDRVEYGLQVANRSLGRVNLQWVLLSAPTPGQANGPLAALDPGNGLRLNEWMAAGGGTNDFVELYNPAALPVSLERWVLTDDPSIRGATNNRIPALTFIDAGAFVRFHTDGAPTRGPQHTPFQLDRFGETIRLLNPSSQIIDAVDFIVQLDGVSEGRYPDGAPQIVRFPGTPTPAAPNLIAPGDADQDGIDNAWETRHGFDPTSPADAAGDADQDGMSNLAEFVSGTNPRDASSRFRVEAMMVNGGSLSIRFSAQPGRAYRVEFSDEIAPPAWRLLESVTGSSEAREAVVRDAVPINQRPARFYRIVVLP
ncbi:MAG: lamin tail domain-containing protein [Verrucomicrobia bacterium]|nr:lamin tail domain-containing protein [Verrucomicrobiota bacterium]